MNRTEADPKGLVRESYAIEGITHWECRSIFVDWALSLPVGADTSAAINVLLEQYAKDVPDEHGFDRRLGGRRSAQAAWRQAGPSGRLAEGFIPQSAPTARRAVLTGAGRGRVNLP